MTPKQLEINVKKKRKNSNRKMRYHLAADLFPNVS